MPEFSIDCAYCPPGTTLLRAVLPSTINELKWRTAWKRTTVSGPSGGPQYKSIECPGCGGQFQVDDDGVAAIDGGLVQRKNISRPRVDSVNVSGGPRNGGTTVILSGSALEMGSLVVKFGSNTATILNRTSTSVTVSTPPGNYSLNIAEGPLLRVDLESVTGTFALDESFMAPGASGAIRTVSGTKLMVYLQALAGSPDSLVGTTLTGGVSGAFGVISAVTGVAFQQGEQITGQASGASGALLSPTEMVVDQPTGSFAPNELVIGASSGAVAKLTGTPAYSGAVDVTVENEHGRREVGGTLAGGFSYI